MLDLMLQDMAKWIPEALGLVIAWYVRQNSKTNEQIVSSISDTRKELVAIERRLEEKMSSEIGTVYRRFEKFAINAEGRISAIEGKCTAEHGFKPANTHTIRAAWDEESDVKGHQRK